MSEELITLLIILATCIPLGLLLGIALRKARPTWCKSYAKSCMNRKWWLFAFGVLMFLGLSIGSFAQGRPYFGVLFLLFVCLEAFALVMFGFKSLTPEQEAQIDASDPTRLWPISFWKQNKTREQVAETDADKPRR